MAGFVGKIQDWLVRSNAFQRNQYVIPAALQDDGTTLRLDASRSNNWCHTLKGNRVLANPTGLKSGMVLNILLDQDATGTRVLTYGDMYIVQAGNNLVLSTAANGRDLLCCIFDGQKLRCNLGKGYS